jgi:DNA repair exonuclease SbcCD ATPase subunit
MFKIKTLTVKNFMSVGNATQAVNFDRQDLTLVLGENLDLGGDDAGARNGTGKTTILNSLSYALYGCALTNIRKENLINKTNGKSMLVTVEFEKDGQSYKIERGRKPNVLKFYIGDQELESKDDNSQGDSRETQQEIERLLGMSHDMFKHLVALNTYTEPFLSLKANDQRAIIEQLLGITLLSEKAELLKEQIRGTKEAITHEEFRIKAVNDANQRILEQVENLKKRQKLWLAKQSEDVEKLSLAILGLEEIDIDAEVAAHKQLEEHNKQKTAINDAKIWIKKIDTEYEKELKNHEKLTKEVALLDNHTCYACGQELHDGKQEEIKAHKESLLKESSLAILTLETEKAEQLKALDILGTLGAAPAVFYQDYEDALAHRSNLENLKVQLVARQNDHDPYQEQIVDMSTTAVEEVNYDALNELVRVRDHQEFLLKLLTNKDSFIRKQIIDQNLTYLNARLGFYLDRIGLPHSVTFQNDLTVEIQELGRELDFYNLSRGESTRLVLCLSWAFRDVWESLYQPINLLFIDELIDNGLDSAGVENAISIMKKMTRESSKSIWLVSHKDELAGRVNNVLTVTKENGYTSYGTSVDIV